MKSKLTLITGCVFLLLCAVLAYIVLKGDAPATDEVAGDAAEAPQRTSNFANTDGAANPGSTRASRPRSRDAGASADLIERFGEARTGLSRKVTTDLAGVIEDTLGLAEMAASMNNSQDVTALTTNQTLDALARRLELTDAQREVASPIIAREVEKRFEAVRQLTTDMRSRPEPFMELFLNGDAFARGTMTEDEYNAATAETRGMLEGVTENIIGRRPQAPMSLGSDEAFLGELSAVLTPEQQAQLGEMAGEQASAPRRGREMPFSEGVPVVELERLDQTVTSARVLTSGMQQVFQGLNGLQQNSEE